MTDTETFQLALANETATAHLMADLALLIGPGDVVTLSGDLGVEGSALLETLRAQGEAIAELYEEREFGKAAYLDAVARSKEYIAAGDMMQVQVGQRLKKRYTESPLSLYRALRSLNPSPYMYFYDMGEFQIVGASPEILVRQERTPEGEKIIEFIPIT